MFRICHVESFDGREACGLFSDKFIVIQSP
jgi:hypothetical protein